MAQLRTKPQLRASTLVEVMAAMVIIMVIFSIGIMVLLNLDKSFQSSVSAEAEINTHHILVSAAHAAEFYNDQIKINNLVYKRTVSACPGDNRCVKIEVAAWTRENTQLAKAIKIVQQP